MKKTLLLVVAASAAQFALAAPEEFLDKEIYEYLKKVNKPENNYLQFEGNTFKGQAMAYKMDVIQEGGKRLAIFDIRPGYYPGNPYLSSHYSGLGQAKLYCVTDDIKSAAAVETMKRMNISVTVGQVKQVEDVLDNRGSVTRYRAIFARCSFSEAAKMATPSPSPNATAKVPEPTPASSKQESHCSAPETTLFACSTGKKLISVCGTQAGVQYRFGPKDRPEISWPEPITDKSAVSQGSIVLAGGGGDYMRFAKGTTSYVVYSASSKASDSEGVVVEQGGKTIANVACKGVASSEFGGQIAKSFGKDAKGFTIP